MIEDLNDQTNVEVPNSSSGNDESLDPALLRPTDFKEYIGQPRLKSQLEIMINSALTRNESLDHLLFFGAPGMGKTSLAQLISKNMSASLVVTSGQALEKTGDVASILATLKSGDILFIDEIHRLRPKVEELLYTAMEDYAIDLVLGKGPTAKAMRLSIENFTLIGATTKLNKISKPLRDRFGAVIQLENYSIEDLVQILEINAKKLDLNFTLEGLEMIAKCSRSTPRIAIHYLKRARDLVIFKQASQIDINLTNSLFQKLGLDDLGLNLKDKELIKRLYVDYNNKPVGLNTLAVALNDDPGNVEDTVEPYLIRLGLLQRTHRGRQLTQKGVKLAKSMV